MHMQISSVQSSAAQSYYPLYPHSTAKKRETGSKRISQTFALPRKITQNASNPNAFLSSVFRPYTKCNLLPIFLRLAKKGVSTHPEPLQIKQLTIYMTRYPRPRPNAMTPISRYPYL